MEKCKEEIATDARKLFGRNEIPRHPYLREDIPDWLWPLISQTRSKLKTMKAAEMIRDGWGSVVIAKKLKLGNVQILRLRKDLFMTLGPLKCACNRKIGHRGLCREHFSRFPVSRANMKASLEKVYQRMRSDPIGTSKRLAILRAKRKWAK